MRSPSASASAVASPAASPAAAIRAASASAVPSSGRPQRRAAAVAGGSAASPAARPSAAARRTASRSRSSVSAAAGAAGDLGQALLDAEQRAQPVEPGRGGPPRCRPSAGAPSAPAASASSRACGWQHDVGDVQPEVGERAPRPPRSSTSTPSPARARLSSSAASDGSATVDRRGRVGRPRGQRHEDGRAHRRPFAPGRSRRSSAGAAEPGGGLHRLLRGVAAPGHDVVHGVGDEQVAVGVDDPPQVVERADVGGQRRRPARRAPLRRRTPAGPPTPGGPGSGAAARARSRDRRRGARSPGRAPR